MESQPQNPEFRINPETLHPCYDFQLFHKTLVNCFLLYVPIL